MRHTLDASEVIKKLLKGHDKKQKSMVNTDTYGTNAFILCALLFTIHEGTNLCLLKQFFARMFFSGLIKKSVV